METILDWTSLATIEAAYISEPVKMSNSKFMIYDQDHHRFMIYDSYTNNWQFLEKGDDEWVKYFAFDKNNNKFYCCKHDSLENKMMVIIRNMNDWESKERHFYRGIDTSNAPVCAFANGKFHVIGAWDNKSHIVYDPETKKFEIVHTFNEWVTGNSGPGLVYVSSKNQFYLLGGFDDGPGWLDDIWRCDMNDTDNTYNWNKIKLKLPQPTCNRYMLTNDERFIIAACDQKIIYHELGTDKWIKSAVQQPSGCTSLIMTGNRVYNTMVVMGYIRSLYMDIPEDITIMIVKWYNCEEIHTIDSLTSWKSMTTYHHKIDVHQIIPQY